MSEQISNETVVNEKPLVTFALFAYNQEKYIREAVEGALAQTYSPLQIILSDDCSSDRTFEIIQEMVAEYAGPHEILLNRNEPNLGLAGHINYVMSLAKGELIVVAAGDDISRPERTLKIVDFYINEEKPDSIFSYFHQIDENSIKLDKDFSDKPREQTVEEFIKNPLIKGASHAWTKRIFEVFGPLSGHVLCEDQVIPFRAYLLNKPRFFDEKLIEYRRLNFKNSKFKFFEYHIKRELSSNRQYLSDAEKMKLSGTLFDVINDQVKELSSINEFWLSEKKEIISSLFNMITVVGINKSVIWTIRRFLCELKNE